MRIQREKRRGASSEAVIWRRCHAGRVPRKEHSAGDSSRWPASKRLVLAWVLTSWWSRTTRLGWWLALNSSTVAGRRGSRSRPRSRCPAGRRGRKAGGCFECRTRGLGCRSGEESDAERRGGRGRRTVRHMGPRANAAMPLATGGCFGDTRGSYGRVVGALARNFAKSPVPMLGMLERYVLRRTGTMPYYRYFVLLPVSDDRWGSCSSKPGSVKRWMSKLHVETVLLSQWTAPLCLSDGHRRHTENHPMPDWLLQHLAALQVHWSQWRTFVLTFFLSSTYSTPPSGTERYSFAL